MGRAGFVLVLALLLLGQPAGAEFVPLDGTVDLPERFRLSADAVIEVELVDVRGEEDGAGARVLSMVAIKPGRERTLPFHLIYDTGLVTRRSGYRLRARARLGEHLVLRSVRSIPVLGELPPQSPSIALEPVPVARSDTSPVGREWLAAEIREAPVSRVTRATLTLSPEGKASGSTGCNRYNGSYQLTGDVLTFGRFATTKRGCTTNLRRQEKDFLRALRDVRGYRRSRGSLVLLDGADLEIIRLE